MGISCPDDSTRGLCRCFLKLVILQLTIEGLCERTEHLNIFFFRPSLNGVLFLMFCLLVKGDCHILVF